MDQNTISMVGLVLEAIAGLIAVIGVYVTLTNRIAILETEVKNEKERREELSHKVNALDISLLDENTKRNEQFTKIMESIHEVKIILENKQNRT